MTVTIRPAGLADLEPLLDLLIADAETRHAADPVLWRLKTNAREAVRAAVDAAMRAEAPAFRQQWLIAESRGRAVGLAHSILLPVPPIYAGTFGAPGLIMEDCAVAEDAPEGTRRQFLLAAERDLIAAGARILLASSVVGGAWEADYARQGYAPLTLYLAKTGLVGPLAEGAAAPATEGLCCATPLEVACAPSPAIFSACGQSRACRVM